MEHVGFILITLGICIMFLVIINVASGIMFPEAESENDVSHPDSW